MYLLLDRKQHSSLKAVTFNRVHGASLFWQAFISTALIIYINPFGCNPGHRPATIGTFQKTTEQVKLFSFWSGAGIPFEQALHLCKGFPVYDGLVGILHDKPFFLRHLFLNVDFIAFHPLAALYHIPHINTVF